MTYIVDFEVDGETVSYTVKAENVLDAEEAEEVPAEEAAH